MQLHTSGIDVICNLNMLCSWILSITVTSDLVNCMSCSRGTTHYISITLLDVAWESWYTVHPFERSKMGYDMPQIPFLAASIQAHTLPSITVFYLCLTTTNCSLGLALLFESASLWKLHAILWVVWSLKSKSDGLNQLLHTFRRASTSMLTWLDNPSRKPAKSSPMYRYIRVHQCLCCYNFQSNVVASRVKGDMFDLLYKYWLMAVA